MSDAPGGSPTLDSIIAQAEIETNHRITRRDVLILAIRKLARAFARLEMAKAHLLNGEIQLAFRGDKEGGVHVQPKITMPSD